MEVVLGTGAKRGGDGRSIFSFFDFQRLKKLPKRQKSQSFFCPNYFLFCFFFLLIHFILFSLFLIVVVHPSTFYGTSERLSP